MKTTKINYHQAESAAQNILRKLNIGALPIRLIDIVSTYANLRIISYTDFADRHGLDFLEVVEFADSDSGCCFYEASRNRYIILYNDLIDNRGHIRWTIAHELGHYVLKHNEKSKQAVVARNSLTSDEYDAYEKEANCFARNILAPPSILVYTSCLDANSITGLCDISFTAASNVASFITNQRELGKSFNLPYQFKALFNSFINNKMCTRCGHHFIAARPKHCPVCSGNSFVWSNTSDMRYLFTDDEVKNMLYDSHPLDENCKALRCPRCDNEEIAEGPYCPICKAYLINTCAGIIEGYYSGEPSFYKQPCNTLALGNHRFCMNCASPTTFNTHNLLEDWTVEKNRKTNTNTKVFAYNPDDEIPF